jgi:hypothetical protein
MQASSQTIRLNIKDKYNKAILKVSELLVILIKMTQAFSQILKLNNNVK